MNRQRGRRVALAVASGAIISLCAVGLHYRGAIVEKWYLRRLERGNDEERAEAAEWLAKRGCRAAIPILVEELALFPSKHKLPPAGSPPTRPNQAWWAVCWPGRALAAMGEPAAAEVIPLLAGEEGTVFESAMEVLRRMGSSITPRLSAAVFEGDVGELSIEGRVRGMWVLRGDPQALGPAVRALDHDHPTVRLIAVQLLESLKAEALPALPRLIRALGDDARVRWRVVHAVRGIGPQAAAAGPALVGQFREAADLRPGYLCDVFRTLSEIYPEGLREAFELAPEGLRPELVRYVRAPIVRFRTQGRFRVRQDSLPSPVEEILRELEERLSRDSRAAVSPPQRLTPTSGAPVTPTVAPRAPRTAPPR